jgi:hypothetical protein
MGSNLRPRIFMRNMNLNSEHLTRRTTIEFFDDIRGERRVVPSDRVELECSRYCFRPSFRL